MLVVETAYDRRKKEEKEDTTNPNKKKAFVYTHEPLGSTFTTSGRTTQA